jgi:hypothetical protein
MSRRQTGMTLLFIAALLHIARYLTVAIFSSASSGWSADLFNAMLQYVSPGFENWSLIALLTGAGYLFLAEVETFRASQKSKHIS